MTSSVLEPLYRPRFRASTVYGRSATPGQASWLGECLECGFGVLAVYGVQRSLEYSLLSLAARPEDDATLGILERDRGTCRAAPMRPIWRRSAERLRLWIDGALSSDNACKPHF